MQAHFQEGHNTHGGGSPGRPESAPAPPDDPIKCEWVLSTENFHAGCNELVSVVPSSQLTTLQLPHTPRSFPRRNRPPRVFWFPQHVLPLFPSPLRLAQPARRRWVDPRGRGYFLRCFTSPSLPDGLNLISGGHPRHFIRQLMYINDPFTIPSFSEPRSLGFGGNQSGPRKVGVRAGPAPKE